MTDPAPPGDPTPRRHVVPAPAGRAWTRWFGPTADEERKRRRQFKPGVVPLEPRNPGSTALEPSTLGLPIFVGALQVIGYDGVVPTAPPADPSGTFTGLPKLPEVPPPVEDWSKLPPPPASAANPRPAAPTPPVRPSQAPTPPAEYDWSGAIGRLPAANAGGGSGGGGSGDGAKNPASPANGGAAGGGSDPSSAAGANAAFAPAAPATAVAPAAASAVATPNAAASVRAAAAISPAAAAAAAATATQAAVAAAQAHRRPPMSLGASAAQGLVFEPNVGQAGGGTAFVARGPGYAAALDPAAGLSLSVAGTDANGRPAAATVGLALVGANAPAAARGDGLLASTSNYFLAGGKAVRDVPNYAAVVYQGVYRGIDLRYHATAAGQLEYDFLAAAGVDASKVKLRFSGADSATVNAAGDLVLHTAAGVVTSKAPVAYQAAANGGPRGRDGPLRGQRRRHRRVRGRPARRDQGPGRRPRLRLLGGGRHGGGRHGRGRGRRRVRGRLDDVRRGDARPGEQVRPARQPPLLDDAGGERHGRGPRRRRRPGRLRLRRRLHHVVRLPDHGRRLQGFDVGQRRHVRGQARPDRQPGSSTRPYWTARPRPRRP